MLTVCARQYTHFGKYFYASAAKQIHVDVKLHTTTYMGKPP